MKLNLRRIASGALKIVAPIALPIIARQAAKVPIVRDIIAAVILKADR